MSSKAASVISYLSLIGWFISFFSTNHCRDKVVCFHLKQSFAMMILSLAFSIVVNITVLVAPSLEKLILVVWLLVPVFWIFGAANAFLFPKRPLPVLGKISQKLFDFIQ